MTGHAIVSMAVFLLVLLALAAPLGLYMARIYEGASPLANRVFGPLERLFHRLAGVRSDHDMGWREYATAVLAFNFVGIVAVYTLQRLQGMLPLNPAQFSGVPPEIAF